MNSASHETIFEIVAWQKMHTPASNCLIMSKYIYSIVFSSSKDTWRASILRRMRTTARTCHRQSRAGIAATMAARDVCGKVLYKLAIVRIRWTMEGPQLYFDDGNRIE